MLRETASSVERKKVLVVDDVFQNIDLLKDILKEDYQVQVAKSSMGRVKQ